MTPPLLAAILSFTLLPQLASAGELSDLIMAPAMFAASDDSAGDGEILRYDHQRQLAPAPDGPPAAAMPGTIPLPDLQDGQAVLARGDAAGTLTLSLAGDGTPLHVVAEYPDSMTNPILLMFLENVVRNITAQTGGSPYYIRNRIRDSLTAAKIATPRNGAATTMLEPFVSDPKRSHLGDFADLQISFTYDPVHPERLIELLARTGAGSEGYQERLSLIPEE